MCFPQKIHTHMRLIFLTQFKIEFLLLFTVEKCLEKMPAW